MKAGRSNQEAPRLPHGLGSWDGAVYRGRVFRRQACLARQAVRPPLPFAPCNTDRRAAPRLARRDIGRRIRSSSAGFVFTDPLALPILGQDAERSDRARQGTAGAAAACACSSRCAAASRRTRRGARSTRACGRSWCSARVSTPSPTGLSRPRTARLRARSSGDPRPTSDGASPKRKSPNLRHVAYVAHDFEHGSMTAALKAAGFDPDKRTFVLWLGVTPYLTEEAVFATLGELGALARRSGSRVRLRQSARCDRGGRDAQLSPGDGRAGGGERRAVPMLFRHSRAARPRPRRSASPRSRTSIARRWSAAICPTRPVAPRVGAGRPCRPDGDGRIVGGD